MAKVRVYELAKEFGVESKAVMAKLNEMGEFVRSASSTIEAPVVRRLKEAFVSQQSAKPQADGAAKAPSRGSANGKAAPAPAAPEVRAVPEPEPPQPASVSPAEPPAVTRPAPAQPASTVTVPFPPDQGGGPQVPPAETLPASDQSDRPAASAAPRPPIK